MIRNLLTAAAIVALALPASATVVLTVDSPGITIPGGVFDARCQSLTQFCLIMTGSVGSDADVLLSDYQLSLSSGSLTDDAFHAFFFTYGPPGLFLTGDPTYVGALFEIDVSPSAPPGFYTGTVTLLDDSFNAVAAQSFGVQIVPEPAGFILMLSGLAVFALRMTFVRRRRNAS